ncbi:cytochrome P450 [Phycicoccus badiiscoriae]|uniref:Cytochrome P450 n=1 Tax=Pedococcus badiiscoriae TaxID=642776 RepID=A0A852WJ38_9MICO|nr:cytochrome P450 [Pedococcus badiiscoriae]NYG06285.1 cytochrome P450 [Pedococcus badiiscoriae]
MIGLTSARTRLTQRLVARATGGAPVDLTSLEAVPRRLLRPLRRSGLDPVYRIGRSTPGPVHRLAHMFGMNIWLVSGQEEVRAVLADQRRFSNDIRPLVGAAGASVGGLGFTDPPEHTRLRSLLTPEFTMRRINQLAPRIEAIVDEQLEQLEARGPVVDLVEHFAFPIPFLVICELLGLPVEDRARFMALSHARFDVTAGGAGAFGAISQSQLFLLEATRKQRADRGDGLLGRILAAVGDDVSDEEVAGLADGVFTGGYETTASMLALGSLVLLRDRKHLELVRDDDSAIDGVVEEMLRYLSVVQIAFPRFAKEDLDLFGKRVRKGDVVIAALSRADRDHRVGPDLGTFDPHRPPSPHVAFGYGFHRCVGAELARLELRIAFPRLVRRFPELALAVEPEALSFRDTSIVYAVDSLPVHLGASRSSNSS